MQKSKGSDQSSNGPVANGQLDSHSVVIPKAGDYTAWSQATD